MRTKNELYQEALRTVARRRQTARARAEDARAEAEAARLDDGDFFFQAMRFHFFLQPLIELDASGGGAAGTAADEDLFFKTFHLSFGDVF